MSSTLSSEPSTEGAPFETLEGLRREHTVLLKRHHSGGSSPDFLRVAAKFIERGRALGILLDRTEERIEAQRILDQWGTVLCKAAQGDKQREDIETTLAEYEGRDLSGQPSPYVGLNPFSEADRPLFFGRDRMREQALGMLSRERLVAIFGLSGSGKSSLVRGGLIPDLRAGAVPESETWTYGPVLVPGAEPLQSLLAAVREALPKTGGPAPDTATVLGRSGVLAELIRTRLPGRSMVVVVDQFEEVFTLCEDARARDAFVAALLALVDDPAAPHRVILTMRSDFEPRLNSLEALQQRLSEGRNILRVTPLTKDELREAIERPARAVGLRFHPEVVDALLRDVGDEIAALPLLQFTLRMLWETRDGDRVTLQQYLDLGGAKGALARRADQLFNEQLIPEDQAIARRILLRMVRIGEGLEVTSGRVRRSSLYEMGFPEQRMARVIEKLVQSGLVRVTRRGKAEDDHLEVAHEAMVRNWQTLMGWLEEDRAKLIMRRRLDDKAAEWVRLGCGSGALLDEVQLAEAEVWLKTADAKAFGYHPKLPALVAKSRETIDAARREKENAEEEKEAARQRELERTQALAVERTLVAARLRRSLVLVLGLFLVAIIIALYAEKQRRAANKARTAAESARIAAQTNEAIAVDQTRKTRESLARGVAKSFLDASRFAGRDDTNRLLFAWHAFLALDDVNLNPGSEITNALRSALLRPQRFAVDSDWLTALAFRANGKQLATVDGVGNVTVWDGLSGDRVTNFSTGPVPPGFSVFNSSGTHLLAVWTNGVGALYDLANRTNIGNRIAGILIGRSRPPPVAISADGSRVAFLDFDGVVHLQKPLSQNRASPLGLDQKPQSRKAPSVQTNIPEHPKGSEAITRLLFNPGGSRLAVLRRDGRIIIYDTDGNAEAVSILIGDSFGRVASLAWSPDGQRIVTGDSSGRISLWDARDGGHAGSVSEAGTLLRTWLVEMAFDGRRVARFLAEGIEGGVVNIWDMTAGSKSFELQVSASVGRVAVFAADLRSLAIQRERHLLEIFPLREMGNPISEARREVQKLPRALSIDDYANVLGELIPEFISGRDLARSNCVGCVDKAINLLRSAERTPGFKSDIAQEVNRVAAASLLAEARQSAYVGAATKAFESYRRASTLDPTLPGKAAFASEAAQILSDRWLRATGDKISSGEILGTIKVFKELDTSSQLTISAHSWNHLCWYGTIAGFAREVIFAGEKAVQLDPMEAAFRDTRGLARVLSGNIQGAIEDFQFYADSSQIPEDHLVQRREWIRQLKAGRKPEDIFTKALLEELRDQ